MPPVNVNLIGSPYWNSVKAPTQTTFKKVCPWRLECRRRRSIVEGRSGLAKTQCRCPAFAAHSSQRVCSWSVSRSGSMSAVVVVFCPGRKRCRDDITRWSSLPSRTIAQSCPAFPARRSQRTTWGSQGYGSSYRSRRAIGAKSSRQPTISSSGVSADWSRSAQERAAVSSRLTAASA